MPALSPALGKPGLPPGGPPPGGLGDAIQKGGPPPQLMQTLQMLKSGVCPVCGQPLPVPGGAGGAPPGAPPMPGPGAGGPPPGGPKPPIAPPGAPPQP
jgi:hypothetical protein